MCSTCFGLPVQVRSGVAKEMKMTVDREEQDDMDVSKFRESVWDSQCKDLRHGEEDYLFLSR